jgi:hypothetical protein
MDGLSRRKEIRLRSGRTVMRQSNKPSTGLKALEQYVDRGTTSVAEVHKQISGVPFNAMEQIRSIAVPARRARAVHDEVIDVIYDSIRRINHAVFKAAEAIIGTGERRRPRPAPEDRSGA